MARSISSWPRCVPVVAGGRIVEHCVFAVDFARESVTVDAENWRLMVASLRYLDTFTNMDGAWFFAERLLYVDWMEERALS